MHPIVVALRSRRRGDPGRPPRTPLWRLLLDELAWAARQALHPAKMVAAAVVAIGAGLLLGPTTPGPVLGSGWLLATAVLLGFIGLALSHALLRRRGRDDEPLLDALRVTAAGAAVLLTGVSVLAWLLAVVVSEPQEATASGLSAGLAIDGPLLLGSILLLGAVVVGLGGDRLPTPAALLFLGLGMLVGDEGLGLVRLDDAALVQSIGVVALVVLLFAGGLSTTGRAFRLGLAPGVALATLGVAITAGIVAVVAGALLGLDPRLAWLLGAVVAPTDAASVLAVLRRTPVSDRLASVLQVESGVNDPVAVLLTVGLLAAWNAPPTAGAWLAFGAVQLVGGVVVGLAIGEAGAWLLRRVPAGGGGLAPMLALAIAGIAYGGAATVGGSGFLATFVAGAVLAPEAPRHRLQIRSFIATLAGGVEVGLLLLLGLQVFPSELAGVAGTALVIAVTLIVVARPLGVAACLPWFDHTAAETGAVAWLGVRGAVPVVLATLTVSAGLPEAGLVFDVVFFVVVLSLLVQGGTAGVVVRRLGLERPDRTVTLGAVLPLDRDGVDVLEVELAERAAPVGRRVADAAVPRGLVVVAVLRDGRTIVPRGDTVLRGGDRLVVVSERPTRAVVDLESWATT